MFFLVIFLDSSKSSSSIPNSVTICFVVSIQPFPLFASIKVFCRLSFLFFYLLRYINLFSLAWYSVLINPVSM